ncbi:FGGY-family carbohydrate kinase [Actibacterium sp. 188UL27-1]|uniref:FGGY-family carbohydrate kinase n=1 Tax=Actibacterium sp. 188UL27-1 TaxID=2786961 RepID=UPI00195EBDC7|nr:FGGY-family carbohydrate kinase [Actibacterium sp. 188UL27-1]MBM7069402.1 carbohydrate kinase [Actibacterium sp. 188UL27-1]
MSDLVLIGLDAGTSVIKAVAFDLSGTQIGIASRRNIYDTLPNGGAEQDMARTWADAAAVLSELAQTVPDLATRAVALGVTGQGDGTWLIDGDHKPLHKGWLWLDARAADHAQALIDGPGHAAIYDGTATSINVCQMRSQLQWIKAHAPDLLAQTAAALHCKDWLYLQLTGETVADLSEALFTFGDYRTRTYSDTVINALGLTDHRHILPPIIDGATTSHALTARAAQQTGLPVGLPVSLGSVDLMCAALAAGLYDPAVEPGLTILGSTGVHARFAKDAAAVRLNADRSGYTMPFPGAAFAQLQTNMAATLNIDWMLGLATQILASQGTDRSPADLLQGLDDHVMAARPGAAIYHPYIQQAGERGPFVNAQARASLTGLDQTTGWFDLMRAVYDGLALAARDCYTAMGPIPAEIRITGGAARSTALRTILASALDRPVRTVAQDEAGAAGAAMIAATAQGIFPDIDAAAQAWVAPLLQDPTPPDPGLTQTYDRLFDAYLTTRHALPPVWQAQADTRKALQ